MKSAEVPQIELSIIIPLLNEEENILEIYRQLIDVLDPSLVSTHEIIFVDDGSRDRSWQIIQELHEQDARVVGLRFSRNFGHQKALKAGLDHACGQAVITMDCDLQHPPSLIPLMIQKWREGFDTINMVRTATENIGFFKNLASKFGYQVINFCSDIQIQPGGSDFRLLDRKVVEQIKQLHEDQLMLRGIVNWLGFRILHLDYKADDRFAGTPQYTFRKSLALMISGVMSFSTQPLRFAVYLGLLGAAGSFLYGIYLFYRWFFYGMPVSGWVTIVLLILLVGGVILLVLGIIGEYVARIYENSKRRPEYILHESIGPLKTTSSPIPSRME